MKISEFKKYLEKTFFKYGDIDITVRVDDTEGILEINLNELNVVTDKNNKRVEISACYSNRRIK